MAKGRSDYRQENMGPPGWVWTIGLIVLVALLGLFWYVIGGQQVGPGNVRGMSNVDKAAYDMGLPLTFKYSGREWKADKTGPLNRDHKLIPTDVPRERFNGGKLYREKGKPVVKSKYLYLRGAGNTYGDTYVRYKPVSKKR